MTTIEQSFSRLGFGGGGLGNLYRAISDEQAEQTLQTAWDGGVRYYDTAPHYGLGLSEKRTGAFLGQFDRDEFVLSTKVGRLLRPRVPPTERDDDMFEVPGDLVRVRDDSREGIRASVEESLERLGLDRIDILWLHDPDDVMEAALATGAPALQELKDEGIIRAWGAGMNSAKHLHRFVLESTPDLIMLAGRHTLLEPTQSLPLLADCQERGVGVVAVGVFNSGLLAKDEVPVDAHYNYDEAPRELVERARLLADICRSHGVSLPAAAMAFPRRHPAVVNVTVGTGRPEQMRHNLELEAAEIPEALFDEIAALPPIDTQS
ncbi:aldo/keto reductase [Aestuariimicrobium ganziense]|uniref:aldo/keto reductase n=1 Tax=Aestuariimicrobium ganziense TaxID=2773677 RepID=UPI0019419EE7|nr:aldo/keto reductase [Aestuariimicrobium ganziense]